MDRGIKEAFLELQVLAGKGSAGHEKGPAAPIVSRTTDILMSSLGGFAGYEDEGSASCPTTQAPPPGGI